MTDPNLPAWFERFAVKVNITEDHWLWTSTLNNLGYGFFRIGDRMRLAHRIAWELANGPLRTTDILDHICRVRECINPAHLHIVTSNAERREHRSTCRLQVRSKRRHVVTTE